MFVFVGEFVYIHMYKVINNWWYSYYLYYKSIHTPHSSQSEKTSCKGGNKCDKHSAIK